jgi:hypothetical protein
LLHVGEVLFVNAVILLSKASSEHRVKEALKTVNLLLVTLGGGIGSAARYLVGAFIANNFGPDFPWGTYVVNVSGLFS